MAYATKYSCTFKDVENITWVIYFQEDGFSGSVTTFTAGRDPVLLKYNGQDKYQPIVGSSADITLVYESDIDNLYTEEDFDIKVLIYRAGFAHWGGYLVPGLYYRQFNSPKHYVTLTAVDGLGKLKDIKFEDGSGDPYFYQDKEIDVIADILGKIDLGFGITETVNIYEDDYDSDPEDSPLQQTYIYPEYYWDELNDESMSCYDVLGDILKRYGANIRQSQSYWLITRPNSFWQDSVQSRTYTSSGTLSTYPSYTTYDEIDSATFWIHGNAELRKMAGLGRCEVTVSNARRENILKNGSFDNHTWATKNGDLNDVPYYWSVSNNGFVSTSSDYMKVYSNGVTTIPVSASGSISTTVDYVKARTIRLGFRYQIIYNTVGGAPTNAAYVLKLSMNASGAGDKYLTNYDSGSGHVHNGDLTWASSVNTTTGDGLLIRDLIADSDSSMSDFEEDTFEFPSYYDAGNFPNTGEIKVEIFRMWCDKAWDDTEPNLIQLRVDRVWLEIESQNDFPQQFTYSYENPSTVYRTERIDLNFADRFDEDYDGSPTSAGNEDDQFFNLTEATGRGNETTSWYIQGDNTASAKLAEVLARQTVEGYRRSLDVIRGTVRTAALTTEAKALKDSNFEDEYGYEKSFWPTQLSYNIHRNEWEGEWVEIPPTYNDQDVDWASDTYGTATRVNNLLTLATDPVGGTDTATSDSYTAVDGEVIRVVARVYNNLGDLPNYAFDGNTGTLSDGYNYLEFTCSSDGAKTFQVNHTDGETAICQVNLKLYAMTGI